VVKLYCDWDSLDCLKNFVYKVVVVGDCLRWLRNHLILHCCYLLYKSLVVAISINCPVVVSVGEVGG